MSVPYRHRDTIRITSWPNPGITLSMNNSPEGFRQILDSERRRNEDVQSRVVHGLQSADGPVSEEVLGLLLSIFPPTAREILELHPGFQIHLRLKSVRMALEVFRQTVRDLVACLDTYDSASSDTNFFNRSNREYAEKISLSIDKEVFAASSAAKALVEHARRLNAVVCVSEYESRCKALASDAQAFILKLRNGLSHAAWIESNWSIMHGDKGRTTHFTYSKAALLQRNDWNAAAKRFIQSSKTIDVRTLFCAYADELNEFYDWWLREVGMQLPAVAQDYSRCLLAVDKAASRQARKFILSLAVERNVDPYDHLHKYLTQSELQEVLALPHGSRQQIDRVIEFVDEFGVCDEELRSLVYRLFDNSPDPSPPE